mgnify:CR=1 FL=1
MIHFYCQRKYYKPPSSAEKGFTMVEVIVAGSILLMVMTGIARISIQSMTSGRGRMDRDRIEAAIHDNIQLIQQADSKLTLDIIPKNEQHAACLNPSLYLKQQLEKQGGRIAVSPPNSHGIKGDNPIKRLIKLGEHTGITRVIYEFSAPEHSIEKEFRVVELNPNFQTLCILK